MTPQRPANVELPGTTVHVHVASLNEADFIEETLESLSNQMRSWTCDDISIILVDSGSTDGTVRIAAEYVDEILAVDRGKLTARDQAIRRDEDAEIIVSVDADSSYPPHWLGHLLAPFEQPEVVGVSAPKLSRDLLYKPLRAWWNLLVEPFSGHAPAPNSAFRRSAYLACGGFDLSVDQYDRDGALNREEEYRFPRRLATVGAVVWRWNAMFTSERQQTVSLANPAAVRKFKREQAEGLRF